MLSIAAGQPERLTIRTNQAVGHFLPVVAAARKFLCKHSLIRDNPKDEPDHGRKSNHQSPPTTQGKRLQVEQHDHPQAHRRADGGIPTGP